MKTLAASTSNASWTTGQVGPGWPIFPDSDRANSLDDYWTLTTTDYRDDRISDLEAQVADLEEKLEALEAATGHDIVERPRWEIVKRGDKK